VVALQALAEYAALTSGINARQNMAISLTADTLTHSFTITSSNALVLQSVQVQFAILFIHRQMTVLLAGIMVTTRAISRSRCTVEHWSERLADDFEILIRYKGFEISKVPEQRLPARFGHLRRFQFGNAGQLL